MRLTPPLCLIRLWAHPRPGSPDLGCFDLFVMHYRAMNIDAASSSNLQSIQSQALSGAHRALKAYSAEAAKLSRGEVDVSSIVEAKQQSTLYTLNLKLISTADEMTGQILNLRA